MFLKAKITKIYKEIKQRFFQINLMARQTSKIVQYDSGGDDYSPLLQVEGLVNFMGDNPRNGFVMAWRDFTVRKSEPGEKRIYSIRLDEETGEINPVAEVHLKNDGSIDVYGTADININSDANVNINAKANVNIQAEANVIINASGNATINSPVVNLGGEGGALVLTVNSTIIDGEGRECSITSNTTTTKAV